MVFNVPGSIVVRKGLKTKVPQRLIEKLLFANSRSSVLDMIFITFMSVNLPVKLVILKNMDPLSYDVLNPDITL